MSDISLQTLHEAVRESREAFEDFTKKGDVLAREKLSKTEAFIEKQEEKNNELIKELAVEKKAAAEFKERLNEMEVKLSQSGLSGKSSEYSFEKKALNKFAKFGKEGMTTDEVKTLNTEAGTQGGFLVPLELSNEIDKRIIEVSPVRSVAKVRTMGKLFRQPVRTTIPTAYWTGEMQSTTESQSAYEAKELVAKTLTVEVRITRQELDDAAFDMVSQIASDVAWSFAEKEGDAFVNGVASPTTPQGFMQAAGVESFVSGAATALTADSLIHITGQLKVGYNPMYAFNRRTRAIIRQLKDSAGTYLWVAGNLGGKIPNELNGYPYIEFINMPDVSAGTYPVVFGDFERGYLIGDRQGMFVIRDDYTLASQNIVRFLFSKRTDGLVVLDEAFKKIQISA